MRSDTANQGGSVRWELVSAIAAAIAAAVAAVVAVVACYMTYYKPPKPFEPSISTGTPMLRGDTTVGVLSIVLSLPIINSGDDTGCISDIGLTLQSKTAKTQWSYFPVFQINIERYLKATANKEDWFFAIEAPASPVKLPGKTTHQQVVLFMPRPASAPKLEPLRVKDLKPGETYVVSVFLIQGDANCQTASTSEYRLSTSTEFVLEQPHIDDLLKGLTVLPLDTARDALREQFVGGRN